MKLNQNDLKSFAGAQARCWSGYFIWKFFSVEPFYTITGILEYIVFLMIAEVVYQLAKPMFIRRGNE